MTQPPGRDESDIFYGERGWFPTYWGFCPNEKAWKAEMARIGCPEEPYPTTDGKCSSFEHDENATIILVTISERLDGYSDHAGVIGVIFHEAVHVLQKICADIGETEPSIEMEAYAVQHIGAQILQEYVDRRRPDFFGAAPPAKAEVLKAE
jgi:hypothetical protein